MFRSDQFHRHPDGAIDYAFYRRRAARLRREAQHAALKRYASAIGRMAGTAATAIRSVAELAGTKRAKLGS